MGLPNRKRTMKMTWITNFSTTKKSRLLKISLPIPLMMGVVKQLEEKWKA